jgi:hypothetical protein
MLVVILLNTCLYIIDVTASEAKKVFRLLVVEGFDPHESSVSGQYLIESLLRYANWNNETDEYVSYIHLLSGYDQDEVLAQCKSHWRGNSTEINIQNQIVGFLGEAEPNEIVIFYYHGHGGNNTLFPDCMVESNVTATELNSWLESVDEEAHVCVILDACYSGSWINDGTGSTFGRGKLTLCSCRSYQQSQSTGSRAWFTGFERITYENFSFLPLGLIGGIAFSSDSNQNEFVSLLEVFSFAKSSTEQYSYNRKVKSPMNPVCYNDLGFDPPLIVRKTAYLIDVNMDGMINILDVSIVALAFDSKPGDDNWNIAADLNNDEWVNIVDISMVALDYGKTV